MRTAAALLGVSDDTLRRAVAKGELAAAKDVGGRLQISGADLITYAEERDSAVPQGGTASSARNRLVGLVTDVRTDTVMAQVQMRCGPHLITSLMSADSARELGLRRGVLAAAVVKSTTVVVESVGDLA
ncbi:putative molybdenum-pterin binding protein [Mobilicoccus pelagius NBRC 104925]|uniref:Putative molybdenum-pterin binding protein n=1 Tax=Mobilicoccus pelagius NBRC 104925 TaxID=1089455 RepID=H5URE4_9MICO|nr:putative molybdenum-pterin binding protein [Mobilicoccus pelagius NBRC 104925]